MSTTLHPVKNVLAHAALGLALVACRPNLTPAAAKVQQIDSSAGCTFVGQVSGSVDYVGPSGQHDAKVKAMNDAAAMGATAIMWTQIASGAFNSQAEGQAYRCQ